MTDGSARRPIPPGHVPRIRYRPLVQRDIPECLPLLPAWLELDAATAREFPHLISRLVDEPSFLSGVMEDMGLPAGQRVQAWGATMILPNVYVEKVALETAPRSDVTARVYEALCNGSLVPMSDRDIGIANTRGDIVMLILNFSMASQDLTDPYVHGVLARANDAFRAFHDGYNLRAIYYTTSAAAEPIAVTSGFRVRQFADAAQVAAIDLERRPALYALSRTEARSVIPGTPARNCFETQPPLFRFSASQRRLLWLALFDESDEALMPALEVSVHGLKKLWRGIYERIEDAAPEFFGDASGEDDGKRGPEKRRQVLAYVRQRAEELRPWS